MRLPSTKLLSVISSNIRYDEPQDKQHCWENRRDFLASCLLEYCPDLLATQEGKHPQLQDMADRLTSLRCADTHRRWEASLMYPCIFYNPDTLTLRESGDIWLSESPATIGSSSFGSQYARLCTWAFFDNDLLAVNVHLDDLKPDTRLHQVRVLMEQIDALGMKGSMLLMGDFNESPEGRVRALINEIWPSLQDPWLELGQEEEPSHHNFLETIDYASRVDWILTDAALQAQEILLDKSRSEQGLYPSDHYLLKARFLVPD
jgi:endonuclease/exonuclease/phosphatase family metal-dependent hydrolase